MAKIIGRNLKPEDEYPHEPGPESNFNESMYFNFFDPERGLGGFVRLGNRVNEEYAEMTVCLYLPDGRVLFGFERPEIKTNTTFDAGGLRFEVIEPTEKLRSVFRGELLELKEPRLMAQPDRAFAESPQVGVDLELVHEAAGPLYGRAGSRTEEDRPAEQQFARAHYEQHTLVRGELRLEGEAPQPLHGHGLRDHSWGPRSWQAIEGYEWLTMNFGMELGAMVSVIRRPDSEPQQTGVLVREGEIDLIRNVSIEPEYEDNGLYHRALRVRFTTARKQSYEIEGTVRSFIPLRHRRGGHLTHVGEGMTEWRWEGRTGYGMSELLRLVR